MCVPVNPAPPGPLTTTTHTPAPPPQDGEHAYIRLNFNYGGSYEPCAKFPRSIFIKELSFRSADTRHAAKVGRTQGPGTHTSCGRPPIECRPHAGGGGASEAPSPRGGHTPAGVLSLRVL